MATARLETKKVDRGDHMHRRQFMAGTAALAASVHSSPVRAQDYPARNVRVVVPYAPGGGTDFVGRVVTEQMAAIAKQGFVVENKGGAAGAVGIRDVAAATPDGYTLLVMDTALVILPAINPKSGLSPSMLAPVALLGILPLVLVAHPSLPADTVPELIEYAKQNPDKLNFCSGGTGTSPHLLGELLKIRAGIEMRHVPYRGAAPALTDVVGGSVQLMFTIVPVASSFIANGQLKALATTGAERLAMLDKVPTMVEAGIKDYVAVQWFGLFAPARTPEPIVRRLNSLAMTAVADAAVAKRIVDQGGIAKPGSAADFARFIEAETISWGEIARTAKVTVDQ